MSYCVLQSNSSFTNVGILYGSMITLQAGSPCSLAYTRAKFADTLSVANHSGVRLILTGASSMEFNTPYGVNDGVPLISGDASCRVTGNLSGYSVKDMMVIPDSSINQGLEIITETHRT